VSKKKKNERNYANKRPGKKHSKDQKEGGKQSGTTESDETKEGGGKKKRGQSPQMTRGRKIKLAQRGDFVETKNRRGSKTLTDPNGGSVGTTGRAEGHQGRGTPIEHARAWGADVKSMGEGKGTKKKRLRGSGNLEKKQGEKCSYSGVKNF